MTRARSALWYCPHQSTAPVPALGCPKFRGDRQKHRQTHTHTVHRHTHTRSLSQAGSSYLPTPALLNPIVQTRGRVPRGLGHPPLPSQPITGSHSREVGRPGAKLGCHPALCRPPSLWAFYKHSLVTLLGQGRSPARNSPKEPSYHLPKLGQEMVK